MTRHPDQFLDADLRATAIPCPACLMPKGKPCHFATGEDPTKWVHGARGLAFWRCSATPSETP